MIAVIDQHRAVYGVEPIGRILPIARSSDHAHAARRRDANTLPARARRDAALKVEIRRVFDENYPGLWRAPWVDWFDHRRLLEPIGYMPPAEAEARYHARLQRPAMAA